MFGRGKKQSSDRRVFGLTDLASDGQFSLTPDAAAAPLVGAMPPRDVAAFYRAHGIELPGLRQQRGEENGVVVWRLPAGDADDAADLWTRLRALHPSTGLWPVLASDDFWERFGDEEVSTDPDIGDGGRWLDRRLYGADPTAALANEIPRRADAPFEPEQHLDWTAMIVAAAGGDPQDILLVPAAASWLVPHVVAWDGAVNSDVFGHDHTAVLRRWSAHYGADLVLLGSDTMAVTVGQPPVGRDAALRAAVEVVAYCEDSLFQGSGSLEALASALAAPLWTFWWD